MFVTTETAENAAEMTNVLPRCFRDDMESFHFPEAAGKNGQVHTSKFCSLISFLFVTQYPCNKACEGSPADQMQ